MITIGVAKGMATMLVPAKGLAYPLTLPVRAYFVVSGGLAGVDAGFITAGAIGYD